MIQVHTPQKTLHPAFFLGLQVSLGWNNTFHFTLYNSQGNGAQNSKVLAALVAIMMVLLFIFFFKVVILVLTENLVQVHIPQQTLHPAFFLGL